MSFFGISGKHFQMLPEIFLLVFQNFSVFGKKSEVHFFLIFSKIFQASENFFHIFGKTFTNSQVFPKICQNLLQISFEISSMFVFLTD